MAVPDAKEKWSGDVTPVTIGATQADGGTRSRAITVGGQTGLNLAVDLARAGVL